jgi:hypothetical protein
VSHHLFVFCAGDEGFDVNVACLKEDPDLLARAKVTYDAQSKAPKAERVPKGTSICCLGAAPTRSARPQKRKQQGGGKKQYGGDKRSRHGSSDGWGKENKGWGYNNSKY